jgi:hypothetical protein
MKYKHIRNIIVLAACIILMGMHALGQGRFTFKVTRSTVDASSLAFRDSIILGRWAGASVCVDLGKTFIYKTLPFVEAELPPAGPGFEFRSSAYAAWNTLCAGATEWVQGLQFDVRGVSGSRTQLDTFRIQLQRDAGAPASDTIRWDTGLATFVDSAFVRHELLGTTRFANMLLSTQWRDSLPSNPNRFLLLLYGAPGVTLTSPACGVHAGTTMTMSWAARTAATKYRVQVSTDSLFATTALHDSSVTGTSRQVSGLTNGLTYYWRVAAGNDLGWGSYSSTCSFVADASLGVDDERGVPITFALEQNYPNPFNPTTEFRFQLPVSGHVKLTIYDGLGRTVATIVDETLPAGVYTRSWNAANEPSGVYYYRLQSGSFVETKKLVVMK